MNKLKCFVSLLIVACICFCTVGCDKNNDTNSNGLSSTVTNSNNNKLESTKDEKIELYYQFIHSYGQPHPSDPIEKKEYDLSQFGGIKDFNSNYNLFISIDGSLYKIGNFSNGTNFKKIDSNVKFVKFKGNAIISEQNDIYKYNEDEFTISILDTNNGYDYINSADLLYVDLNLTINGFLKNKELFLYECYNGMRDLPQNAIYKFDVDEEIEYFIDNIIKTNKGFYYLDETINESEFDDVTTTYEYSLKKLKILVKTSRSLSMVVLALQYLIKIIPYLFIPT